MNWHIGTMGFSYTDWLPNFYPDGTRPGEFLSAYAAAFDTVELDTTFHAIPPLDRVKKWADSVPDAFSFCVKTPKAITHDGPLAIGMPLMRQFLSVLAPMKQAGKLGAVLIQFPPAFTISELPEVRRFLKELPPGVRYALEFRNSSWEREETGEMLRKFGCCWVTGDYGVDPYPIHVTTDFLYLRLIGIHEQFARHDRERIDMTDRLAWWQEQIETAAEANNLKQILVMVNNDYAGHSPSTANRLRGIIGLGEKLPPRKEEQDQGTLFGA
jgi:uncharacterized protein YecE (DUF72 family)